jgi:hypothetical protein
MVTSGHSKQPAELEPQKERQPRVEGGAPRALAEPERMALAGADREAFLDAVGNPPEPAEKLVAALRRGWGSDDHRPAVASWHP